MGIGHSTEIVSKAIVTGHSSHQAADRNNVQNWLGWPWPGVPSYFWGKLKGRNILGLKKFVSVQ